MIKSKASKSELTSPYFEVNRKLADLWNEFSNKVKGKPDGVYNSYGIEFTMDFVSKGVNYTIQGQRKLNNVTTNSLPFNAVYSELLYISAKVKYSSDLSFKIVRASLITRIKAYFSSRNTRRFQNNSIEFILLSNKASFLDFFLNNSNEFIELLDHRLVEIMLKEDKYEAKFVTLFKELPEIEKVFDKLEELMAFSIK